MDWKRFTKDPGKVHANFVVLPDKRLVTKKGCKIYIPTRFEGRNLAEVGIVTYICGICAYVVDDQYYGVGIVNAMMKIEPTSTMKVDFDGDEYYEFSFDAGATVISSIGLVKSDTLVYRIYDEIFSKGHVPWYMGYAELARIFDTAQYHAGANVGKNHEITEMLVSLISRDKDDRHLYYRTTVKDKEYLVTNPPCFISLRSVPYSATNTLNKIAGSYQHEGIISALVSPTTRVERLEAILRK